MKPKGPQLSARWGRREKDVVFRWDDGCSKADGALLCQFLCNPRDRDGKALLDELEARGYDLKTLQFSIRKPPSDEGDE